jgi:hypothetical protein
MKKQQEDEDESSMVIINRRETKKRKCFFWSFGFPAPSTLQQSRQEPHRIPPVQMVKSKQRRQKIQAWSEAERSNSWWCRHEDLDISIHERDASR